MCDYSVLITLDKNGKTHRFIYEAPEEDQAFGGNWDQATATFTYRVKTEPKTEYCFEFTVQQEGQDRLRVVMMENHGREEYRAKGIPEAMILMLARSSGKTVTSSSNRAGPGEYRTTAANKIWQRLLGRRSARYSLEEDRYYAIAPPKRKYAH